MNHQHERVPQNHTGSVRDCSVELAGLEGLAANEAQATFRCTLFHDGAVLAGRVGHLTFGSAAPWYAPCGTRAAARAI